MKKHTSITAKASPLTLAGAGGAGLVVGIAAFLLAGSSGQAGLAKAGGGAASQPVAGHPTTSTRATSATPPAAAPPVIAAPSAPGKLEPGEVIAAPGDTPPDASALAAAKATATQLEEAHARLHQPSESKSVEDAVVKALDDVYGKNKVDKRFAKDLYAVYGPGRFVRSGQLTALGEGVLARVKDLESHAIDPTPYHRDELEASYATMPRASAGAGGAVGPAGAAFAVAIGALTTPTFDRQAVEERLAALAGELDNTVVARALAQVMGTRGDAVTVADIRPDLELLRTFVDLVFDFRFLHKAGPFVLRDRADVFEREKKDLEAFIGQVLGTTDASAALALLDPPHPQYARMREVYALYRGYTEAKTCEKLPAAWRFRKGSKGKEVVKLQERLACEGYYEGANDGVYDGPTTEAVKAFQRHHDLEETGQVLDETMGALNISMEYRVKQIALALQRMREGRFDRMGDMFLRVNLPAFTLRAYENGKVIKEHRVIVGTNKLDDDKVELTQGHINRTKLFGTRLYEVIVNPTWILPKRVEAGELATGLEKDPDHLAKSNIKKVRLGSGTEVYVQGSGEGNVLGKVKFLLEGTNAIYLHDTNKRHLFKKRRRDFSHGCMRIHEADEFARWLLGRDGWTEQEVSHSLGSSVQRGFDLKKPVNLVTEYITVDLADDGFPIFFDDIYGYDSAFYADKLPPSERTRWGSAILRPRWVPVIDSATVEDWRKAGKSAPRDLGPDGKPLKKAPKGDDSKEP